MWDDVILFTAVGFAAQLIDGALGMAYGLSATTVLLSLGTAPAMASASVHAAEVFTTAASGAAHWRVGNVDPGLVVRLAIPGMIGGALGAYVLASLPGEAVRPYVAVYLFGMGVLIVWRGLRQRIRTEAPRHVIPLGLFGGFVDAIGGGGWGPLVASTLVGRGAVPRMAIGSVNLAEFFVTLTVSVTFLATVGLELVPVIAGLVLGGVVAAPFAALATRHIPDRPLMLLVGVVIVLLSLRELVRAILA
ncbi:MAG TPA: sulfite exporter TauE/SafE family protein [Methylomirabilota bacterium]|jgi:uncharacterized protein|nr:sulfite exporter TauE/SafE family protein [Methylomirabilota bacterium]